MQFSKGMLLSTIILSLAACLSGCASSLIGVHEGAERVSLAVTACQSKGKTIVTVLAKVGIILRYEEDVEENLYQLARNNAVDAGADTLVKGESKEFGKRMFEMYKCRP
jgi:hypothetical protein